MSKIELYDFSKDQQPIKTITLPPEGNELEGREVQVKDLESATIDNKNDKSGILHGHIQYYARFIVEKFKEFKDKTKEEQRFFILDALSDQKIFARATDIVATKDEVKQGTAGDKLTPDEAGKAIEVIRNILIKELNKLIETEGKIGEEIYLIIKDFKRKDGGKLNAKIKGTKTGDEFLLKNKDQVSPESIAEFKAASEILATTKPNPHPNIRQIVAYDANNNASVNKDIVFVSLDTYLENNRELFNTKIFFEVLQFLKGHLQGAAHLASTSPKLVLKDLGSKNLGVETMKDNTKRGTLFDTGELVREGSPVGIGQEVAESEQETEILDDWNQPRKVTTYRMVYEVGKGLQKVIDTYFPENKENPISVSDKVKELVKELKVLYYNMTRKCAFNKEVYIANHGPNTYTNEDLDRFAVEYRDGRITAQEANELLGTILADFEAEEVV
jgi:hypothetical protein